MEQLIFLNRGYRYHLEDHACSTMNHHYSNLSPPPPRSPTGNLECTDFEDIIGRVLWKVRGKTPMGIRALLHGLFARGSWVPPMDTVENIFILLQEAQLLLVFTQHRTKLCYLLLPTPVPHSLLLNYSVPTDN